MKANRSIAQPVPRSSAPALHVCLLLAWALLACVNAPGLDASRPAVDLEIMAPPGGYAIGGVDPVSYFQDAGPRKGSPEISYRWREATWLFTTSAHRDAFEADPARYAPAYGGWCAYGMAEGYAAQSDPLNGWTIREGVLYLNWDAEVTEEWLSEVDSRLVDSEENWPDVRETLRAGTAEVYWHEGE